MTRQDAIFYRVCEWRDANAILNRTDDFHDETSTHYQPHTTNQTMFLSTKRIIKAGFINFWRNSFVSLASILVMVITLFVIGALIFANAMMDATLEQIRDKVDIDVYFITTASEESILAFGKELEALEQVETVGYISREQALEDFRTRRAGDAIALQALEELDDNPLQARLRIKATDPIHYEFITGYIDGKVNEVTSDGVPIIAKVNFHENRVAIDRLTSIIDSVEKFGFFLTIALIAASILITFNTVRLAIYTARDEISVMRLVGASYAYIRGPFVFEGVMYGAIAGIITLVLFYPLTLWMGAPSEQFFGEINIFTYYTNNFASIFLTIMGSGIALGVVSSFLAVKKYLRI